VDASEVAALCAGSVRVARRSAPTRGSQRRQPRRTPCDVKRAAEAHLQNGVVVCCGRVLGVIWT